MPTSRAPRVLLPALLLACFVPPASAGVGEVLSNAKISKTQGGLVAGALDEFGFACARVDDLDGDGVPELAVGEHYADDGGTDRGAVWIVFLHADGSVKGQQKISSTQGGFTGALDDGDEFGYAVASLGDVDGDGVCDLAVGAPGDDDGGTACGAAWVLFLNPDGTVEDHQKLSNLEGGLSLAAPVLDPFDRFGRSLAWLGDFDANSFTQPALAVGAPFDDDGATLEDRGAVWILFLHKNGSVAGKQKISSTIGGFFSALDDYDWFGSSLAALGDQDGDGIGDIAVGALRDDDGGTNRGAVYIVFLEPLGTVKSERKISTTTGGFTGDVDDFEEFGTSVAALDDMNGDGHGELAVGTPRYGALGSNRGAVWVLFLDDTGLVQSHQKIDDATGGFTGQLQNFDVFGGSLASLGDLDGDGRNDLCVGAHGDDDGGPNFGAVWLLFLDGAAPAAAQAYGCGANPPGSMAYLSAQLPAPGAAIALGLSNPEGTQSSGFTYLMLSFAPWPSFPCGLPAPGAGMIAPGFVGELLVDPTLYLGTVDGTFWQGLGTQAQVSLFIPANSALLGVEFYAQGLIVSPGAPAEVGLTEGMHLTIGV